MRIASSKRPSGHRQGLPIRVILPAMALGVAITLALAAILEPSLLSRLLTSARAQITETHSQLLQQVAPAELPVLHLDIAFEGYQALSAKRDQALSQGVLQTTDLDWVRAQIRYGQHTIPVKVRLKGDWLDHLQDHKWSFRVEVRNEEALFGMRSFSLQSPHTRSYLNEWLFLSELRQADILAPRYTFVQVFVNGDDWGYYALEESFGKELVESMGRREGVLCRYDETLAWEYWASSTEASRADAWAPSSALDQFAFAPVDDFDSNRVQSDPVLSQQSAAATGLLRGFQQDELLPSQAFDAEVMGRFLAHTMLWGAGHGLIWHNARYYFNPLTAHLEPVGYDCMPLDPEGFPTELAQYQDLEIMRAYAQEMTCLCAPGYLEDLQARYGESFGRYAEILSQEFDPALLALPWQELATRRDMLAAVFVDQTPTVYVYQPYRAEMSGTTVDASSVSGQYDTELYIGNLLRYPVRLTCLCLGDHELPLDSEWLHPDDRGLVLQQGLPDIVLEKAQMRSPRYLRLSIPQQVMDELTAGALPTDTLSVRTNLVGLTQEILVPVRSHYAQPLETDLLPARPTVNEALALHPFLARADEPEWLELAPGSYDLQGDLVLPEGYGLRGRSETTLRFAEGAMLFSSGPLDLVAPDMAAIRFEPQTDHWAGVMVLRAQGAQPSLLSGVEIAGTSGFARNGWTTTGGVTFYESPLILERVTLSESNAEDGLNVVRGSVTISQSIFCDLASDAFDGDSASVLIADCEFRDIRGDAIDVSASDAQIQNVGILRVRDKGISAGEASIVRVQDAFIHETAIGVASKDLSQVTIKQSTIQQATIAGLAAYVKKPEYGTARIEADDIAFADESPRSLAQIGSSIILDGEAVLPQEVDVDELYVRLEALSDLAPLSVSLGSSLYLNGYYFYPQSVQPGDRVYLLLSWSIAEPVDQDYSVFAHLLDPANERVAQNDGMPRDNAYPTSRWQAGQVVEELRPLTVPEDAEPGDYAFYVGMYDYMTGERLPVSQDGTPSPEAAVWLPVRLQVLP